MNDLAPIPFTREQSLVAHQTWGANCGPHAIATACNVPLERLEQTLHPFPGWMGPSQMEKALLKVGRKYIRSTNLYTKNIQPGISRIQFHGPWLKPNRPPAEAYKHTHWVTCRKGHVHDTIFEDALATWIPISEWRERMELFAEKEYAGWHITHWYRILKLQID